MFNPKFKSFYVANNLRYNPNIFGTLYNLLFSIKGRAIIFVYYTSQYSNIISFYTRRVLKKNYHFEVGKNLSIGYSLILNHPYNIILDSNCVIGNNCQIDQNVTLGGNMKKSNLRNQVEYTRPVIGNNVIVCSGSLIAGPIKIGDNCIVGANATVTFDVEDGSIVYNTTKVSQKKITVGNGTYKVES